MSEYVVHESEDGSMFNIPVEKITRCRDCSIWPCEWNWDEEEPDGFCSWARPKRGDGSRAKAESVYDRGVKYGMRIVFYELEQMEDFEGLQDYIAAYRATDGSEEAAHASSEESGIPESVQMEKPSNDSDAVDFCKRVEKAAKDRAPLELFGVSYEAVGDEPFCEQVDRWLHGDAPQECRECTDGKYAKLTALVDNTCTLKPLTPFATALMGILKPEWGVCSACGSATPKVGNYCAICGAHVVKVVDE